MAPMYSGDALPEFSPVARQRLLEIALDAIQSGLGNQQHAVPASSSLPDKLSEYRASFVTLESCGSLRGCIGSLEPHATLLVDVSHNARAAAFRDPRFQPLQAGELQSLNIRISILGTPEKIEFNSEQDLIGQLRPGTDGLILEENSHKGTFLPSVWDSLPEPANFLEHLKLKTGLPAQYWSDSLKVWRYTTESFDASVASIHKAGGPHREDMLK